MTAHPRVDAARAAIRHIEIAEKHLRLGADDPEYFNDVVYRTNQAFEGMLKEAYTVLADSDGSKLSTHHIEQLFAKEGTLAPRVQTLFTNYRQQWRNPSTHDHTLLLSRQEALLAIVSVSAFALVLFDQMVEAISFHAERSAIAEMRGQLKEKLGEATKGTLAEQVVQMLGLFGAQHETSIIDAELVGRVSGFLVGTNPEIQTLALTGGADAYGDILVTKGAEQVLVEIKRARDARTVERGGVSQLLKGLVVGDVPAGVLYLISTGTQGTPDARHEALSGKEIWVVKAFLAKSPGNAAKK